MIGVKGAEGVSLASGRALVLVNSVGVPVLLRCADFSSNTAASLVSDIGGDACGGL